MFKEGLKIRVLDVKGFEKITNRIGVITNKIATHGKVNLKQGQGFNVDLGKLGVWRISYEDGYELKDRFVNEKFFFSGKVTQTYEKTSYSYTTIVKNSSGDVIMAETNERKGGLDYTVTYNKKRRTTTVVFNDGSKGVARCRKGDYFNIQIGHDIAWHRANIARSQKIIELLGK